MSWEIQEMGQEMLEMSENHQEMCQKQKNRLIKMETHQGATNADTREEYMR